ncbi:MAG: UbiA family prenyltransferase [Candidatus Anstonellales archaeon]
MLKTISEWAKLFRIEHGIMLSISAYIGLKLAKYVNELNIIFYMLVPLLIQMGAFALNDYFDIEADKKNKRYERPLIKGTIKPMHAYIAGITCLFIGIITSMLINEKAFLFVIFLAVLSYLYNTKLKDIAIVGNIYIAFTMAAPFLYASIATNRFNNALMLISISSFLIGLAREIIKTVQDYEGDVKARKSKTLPFYIGKKNSMNLASFILLLFFIPAFILLYELHTNYDIKMPFIFTSLYIISIAIVAYCLAYAIKDMHYEMIRKMTLFAIALTLLSLILGL